MNIYNVGIFFVRGAHYELRGVRNARVPASFLCQPADSFIGRMMSSR